MPRPWNRPEHWSAAEVDYLERWFGRKTDAALARKLGRTVVGLRLKAKRLGLRKMDAGMTGREVERIFGFPHGDGRVQKVWLATGLLRATRGGWDGPNPGWLIEPAELERFIRDHPEHVDVDRMPDSVYRDLAARNRWVSLREVHRLTGRGHHAVAKLIRDGTVRGAKRGTHWYVPLADVPRIRPLRPDAIADSVFRRESVLAMRRCRRKLAA